MLTVPLLNTTISFVFNYFTIEERIQEPGRRESSWFYYLCIDFFLMLNYHLPFAQISIILRTFDLRS